MLEQAARRDPSSRIERLCAEAEAIPLPDASIDLVYSNLMLPWCEDIDAVFAEIARVLAPQGLVTFTTLGPDTLVELRTAWRTAGGGDALHPFTDMHDLGDGLVRAGLTPSPSSTSAATRSLTRMSPRYCTTSRRPAPRTQPWNARAA